MLKTARTFFIFSQWVLSYQLEWNIVTEYINVYKVELNQWRLCQQSKCRSKDSHRGSEAMVQSSGAYREGALPRSLNIGFALAESSASLQRWVESRLCSQVLRHHLHCADAFCWLSNLMPLKKKKNHVTGWNFLPVNFQEGWSLSIE